jgi:hypothetical protein
MRGLIPASEHRQESSQPGGDPIVNESENGVALCRLQAVNPLAGAKSDRAEIAGNDLEPATEWLRGDREFIAALNRAKSYRRERLWAEVRSPASDAMATLRELISAPRHVPLSVRLRASLAILQAADAMKAEELGPMAADGVEAAQHHKRFLESLGG